MAKSYCVRVAGIDVGGSIETSRLHQGLLHKISTRPIANLVYGMYLQNGVADAMDQAGYRRDPKQNQHTADDVIEYLGFQNIEYDIADATIKSAEMSVGTKDVQGHTVLFNNGIEALEKAKKLNDMKNRDGKSAHIAAVVVKRGDKYEVIAKPISSKTNSYARRTDDLLYVYEEFKRAASFQNLDVDALMHEFPDILTGQNGMIAHIKTLSETDNHYINERETEFILAASRGKQYTDALLSNFTSLKDAAHAVYEHYHGHTNTSFAGYMERAMKEGKDMYATILDDNFSNTVMSRVASNERNAEDALVSRKLKDLNAKYGIDYAEIKLQGKHVKSLSEAVAKSIAILEKRIRELDAQKGTTSERKKLDELRHKLLKELENERYYTGIIEYIAYAYDTVTKLDDALGNIQSNGTKWENAVETARVLYNQSLYTSGDVNLFRDLLEDLSDIDAISVDENISQDNIDVLKEEANKVTELLHNVQKRAEKIEYDCMTDLVEEILGVDKVGQHTVAQIVNACSSEFSLMDMLYSFGKLSNALGAAIGDVVRTAQDKRDSVIESYTSRIREATSRLYHDGKTDSSFMYVNDYLIISDYDFEAYRADYNTHKRECKINGNYGYDLEALMDTWEKNNTIEVVVDSKSGRTERVPRLDLYKMDWKAKLLDAASTGKEILGKKWSVDEVNNMSINSFRDALTKEQLDYYDTMMQIKGELGTMLPEYAQKQFFPPQIRRDLITAISEEAGLDKESVKNVAYAVKEKAEELFKVKEDDTEFAVNGYKASDYSYVSGDLAGHQYRQIPIFFVNPVKSGEVYKNMSAGIQALAATAVNYNEMSNVRDIVEFMSTYMTTHESQVQNAKGGYAVDSAGNSSISVLTDTSKKVATSLFGDISRTLIERSLYGVNMRDDPFFAKTVSLVVGYTSFKSLSTNWIGATANVLEGQRQLFEMGLANSLYKKFVDKNTPYFTLTDWMSGFARLFAEVGVAGADAALRAADKAGIENNGVGSVLLDLATRDKRSIDYLLAEKFNVFNDNFGEALHNLKYYKGARRLVHDPSFLLYTAGEYSLRYNTMWALMRNRKVEINGRKTSMRNMFKKEGYKYSPHLAYVGNVTVNGVPITDVNGNLTAEGEKYLNNFMKDLRYCCQGMFGAMNDEDKGAIHTLAIGRMGMNFRQWMVGQYSERFRGLHWDYDKKEFVRGFWTSAGNYVKKSLTSEEFEEMMNYGSKVAVIGEMTKNLLTFRTNFRKEWYKASPTEKLDLLRIASALTTYMVTFGMGCWLGGGLMPAGILPSLIGSKEDERKRIKKMSPQQKFAYYQMRRLLYEEYNSLPLGAFVNFETIVKSPLPAIRTFDNALYVFTGLGDLGTEIKSGPNKGMDKYWRNVLKYNVPFWKDYQRWKHFGETSTDVIFGMFDPDNNNMS